MSNSARLAVPGTGDDGKVPVYDETGDAWELALPVAAAVTLVTKSAAWTLALAEAECFYLDDTIASHNITIPTNASVAIPVGSSYSGQQRGAGQATFVYTGVTLDVRNGTVQTAGQHATWTLLKTGTDRWVLTGDLV